MHGRNSNSTTSRGAPTGHKRLNFISRSLQPRRWAHIKRSAKNFQMNANAPDPSNPLCGVWRYLEDDSDDYFRAEYTVSVSNGAFQVSGIDRSDGEAFEISDISWNGVTLSFHSYVPSTARCGISQIRYVGDGKVEFLFTFTVLEVWGRYIEEAEQGEAQQPPLAALSATSPVT
jgi:hypothetical protein